MHHRHSDKALRERLASWFDTPLGRSVQAFESHRLREILPSLYGTVALQLGRVGQLDMLDASAAPTRVLLDLISGPNGVSVVHGRPEEIPLDTNSADVVILPFKHGSHSANTSTKATVLQGTYLITTSLTRRGYDAGENTHFVAPDDWDGMRHALERPTTKSPWRNTLTDGFDEVCTQYEEVFAFA